MHMVTRGIRNAFMRWKKKSDSIATVEDVNDCGPVVEDVLECKFISIYRVYCEFKMLS